MPASNPVLARNATPLLLISTRVPKPMLGTSLELTANLTGKLMGYRTFDRRFCITGCRLNQYTSTNSGEGSSTRVKPVWPYPTIPKK
jgi:hypothetical protein